MSPQMIDRMISKHWPFLIVGITAVVAMGGMFINLVIVPRVELALAPITTPISQWISTPHRLRIELDTGNCLTTHYAPGAYKLPFSDNRVVPDVSVNSDC